MTDDKKSIAPAFTCVVRHGLPEVETLIADGQVFVGDRGGILVSDRPNVATLGYKKREAGFSTPLKSELK